MGLTLAHTLYKIMLQGMTQKESLFTLALEICQKEATLVKDPHTFLENLSVVWPKSKIYMLPILNMKSVDTTTITNINNVILSIYEASSK